MDEARGELRDGGRHPAGPQADAPCEAALPAAQRQGTRPQGRRSRRVRRARTARRALAPVWIGGLAILGALAAAAQEGPQGEAEAPGSAEGPAACAPDDAGLELPDGWCAQGFAENLGRVRNLAVAPDGTVFVARKDEGAPALVALRDEDGDGRAEGREAFGPHGPAHDVVVHGGSVWLGADRQVLRFPLPPEGALAPQAEGTPVVQGLPEQQSHARKGIAVTGDALYVAIGAPSNACQTESRTPRSPGKDPCPELEHHAGIWRFDPERSGQTQADGTRFATGMRHTLALAPHPESGALFAVVNGRDQLHSLWGWPVEENARLPAEEMMRVEEGDDFGWPYCFYDARAQKKLLAPEYGGDGEETGRCADKQPPDMVFPAHWAPMDLAFAGADVAYVAFRGSWNRAPLPQEGYQVARVPFEGGMPKGEHEVFARDAEERTGLRFTGVAVGPDGGIYVSAENAGRIWRIVEAR